MFKCKHWTISLCSKRSKRRGCVTCCVPNTCGSAPAQQQQLQSSVVSTVNLFQPQYWLCNHKHFDRVNNIHAWICRCKYKAKTWWAEGLGHWHLFHVIPRLSLVSHFRTFLYCHLANKCMHKIPNWCWMTSYEKSLQPLKPPLSQLLSFSIAYSDWLPVPYIWFPTSKPSLISLSSLIWHPLISLLQTAAFIRFTGCGHAWCLIGYITPRSHSALSLFCVVCPSRTLSPPLAASPLLPSSPHISFSSLHCPPPSRPRGCELFVFVRSIKRKTPWRTEGEPPQRLTRFALPVTGQSWQGPPGGSGCLTGSSWHKPA